MSAAPMSVRCVPMSGMVTMAGTKVPMRLPAVERAKMRPATRPASSTPVAARRIAKRRDHAEQHHGGREQGQRRRERADHGARRERLDALDREVEERLRHEGDHGHPGGGRQDDDGEELRRGVLVGDASAQPVAHGERAEDQADDVCPHHCR